MQDILERIAAATAALKTIEKEIDSIGDVLPEEKRTECIGAIRSLRSAYDKTNQKTSEAQDRFLHFLATCVAASEGRMSFSVQGDEYYAAKSYTTVKLRGSKDSCQGSGLNVRAFSTVCAALIEKIAGFPKIMNNSAAGVPGFVEIKKEMDNLFAKVRTLFDKETEPA
jgi:hypothetical protein